MSEILDKAIGRVACARAAWCRYITANDTGTTGSHQQGFYVPKHASGILFDTPGRKGENKDKMVTIRWQDDFETASRFIYYGQGTRNEYRVTRFGKGFPFFTDDNVGNLLILAKHDDDHYFAFVLSADEDIDAFFAFFNLSPNDTNRLIEIQDTKQKLSIENQLADLVSRLEGFLETKQMAFEARECYNRSFGVTNENVRNAPDSILLGWIETEYQLFKCLENKLYGNNLGPFPDVETFVRTANEVLNRRKARAGKSLEHHLSDIFTNNNLIFEEQALTEGNKRPDFLFPNSECYHNLQFPADDLIVLGAKTTCKDRWRQVLTEADRVESKYLFTLQQGISSNQLREMRNEHLRLVVPSSYISLFPKPFQSDLIDLAGFIRMVAGKQHALPQHFLIHP